MSKAKSVPLKSGVKSAGVQRTKFKVGQVVAIFHDCEKDCPGSTEYHKISGFFFDSENKMRYTFSDSKSLCPVEEILRAQTKKEAGLR